MKFLAVSLTFPIILATLDICFVAPSTNFAPVFFIFPTIFATLNICFVAPSTNFAPVSFTKFLAVSFTFPTTLATLDIFFATSSANLFPASFIKFLAVFPIFPITLDICFVAPSTNFAPVFFIFPIILATFANCFVPPSTNLVPTFLNAVLAISPRFFTTPVNSPTAPVNFDALIIAVLAPITADPTDEATLTISCPIVLSVIFSPLSILVFIRLPTSETQLVTLAAPVTTLVLNPKTVEAVFNPVAIILIIGPAGVAPVIIAAALATVEATDTTIFTPDIILPVLLNILVAIPEPLTIISPAADIPSTIDFVIVSTTFFAPVIAFFAPVYNPTAIFFIPLKIDFVTFPTVFTAPVIAFPTFGIISFPNSTNADVVFFTNLALVLKF